jgi:flagellar biosynthesis protein FlhF
LVGPAGAGKTTTLAKLAVAYGIAKRRTVRLISTDTYRLGGTDLLRRYADAMGVAFEAPPNVDALQRTLQKEESGCLTLIDTPGPSANNGESNAALASFLAKRADIDVHLVLPSFAGSEELRGMAGKFKSFVPSKLLFTGLDNCSNTGPMLAFALHRETAISFLGTGPEVPEDLEEATAGSLTARLLPFLMDAVVAAA